MAYTSFATDGNKTTVADALTGPIKEVIVTKTLAEASIKNDTSADELNGPEENVVALDM